MVDKFRSFADAFKDKKHTDTDSNIHRQTQERPAIPVDEQASLPNTAADQQRLRKLVEKITVLPEDTPVFQEILHTLGLNTPKSDSDVARVWRIQELLYESLEQNVLGEVKRLFENDLMKNAHIELRKAMVEIVRRGFESESTNQSNQARTYPHVKDRAKIQRQIVETAEQFATKAKLSSEEIADQIGIDIKGR